jgi:hypothetical protein
MEDGFLLDSSRRWPFLDELLHQGGEIIADRGMTRKGVPGREWIRDIFQWTDLEAHPAFLDFGSSSDVVSIVSEYLGFVPSLSATVPPGIRLTESHEESGPSSGMPYRLSQLFHGDLHDSPMVYVIVLLRDVFEESGPFCFLSASASERVSKGVGYRKRGRPHHLTDEEVFRWIDPGELHVLTGEAGTVLFIDPSLCLHYGSRDSFSPRYQAMYAYVSPCRTDFTPWMMSPRAYPVRSNEEQFRRLLLDPLATR